MPEPQRRLNRRVVAVVAELQARLENMVCRA